MTKKNKSSATKVLFTVLQIFIFVAVMLYADVFGNSSETTIQQNPIFLWEEENKIWINPDNASIDIELDGDDNAVIYYIVQSGDNLEKISKEFWVPVAEIKKINKITKPIKAGDKLIVSDDEDGILYIVKNARTLKLFAEYYRLNLDDLITLNHFSDESEMLYPGQEIFINVTEQRAYDIGLLEKPQPILPKDEIVRKPAPKRQKVTQKTTRQQTTRTTVQKNTPAPAGMPAKGQKKQWHFNKKISNGFAAGYCTWYAAHISPWMYKDGQRLFGGNAKDWYENAQSAKAKEAGIKTVNRNGKPRVGAIVVYNPLRSYAGHVAVVKAYFPESGEMLVEDMNYVGKYIVTQRWDNVSNPKIKGYIYH